MSHFNLLAQLTDSAWAITAAGLVDLTEKARAYLAGNVRVEPPRTLAAAGVVGPVDWNGQPMIPQLEIVDGIGVIRVKGPLMQNVGWIDAFFGAYDYAWLQEMISEALDRGVSEILLSLDTPGGSHLGMEETAAVIAQAAQAVPVFVFTNGMCCSAGYGLAAEAASIYSTPSAMVGSLGSKIVVRDSSGMFQQMGIRVETYTSGAEGEELALKAMMEPGKPITEPEREFFRSMVRESGTWVRRVKERRPKIRGAALQGGFSFGKQAVIEGLVDQLAPNLATVAAGIKLARLV